MKMKHLVLGIALGAMMGAAALTSKAQAEDSVYVPIFSYRTGPFSVGGIPIANGMHDYFTMLNERDGGIGGAKVIFEECETGYNTKKGVECYESIKGKNPTVISPYSTGITLQLIPKAAVDKIPVLSMAYGLSASANGQDFPWIYNPPSTYWDGLSIIMKYIGGKEGGLDKLKGKTIGFIFLESGYGREPIPLLQQFAKDYGFNVKLYSVAFKESQDQAAQWLAIRRDRPAWLLMWGWGAMNPTAVKRAAENGFAMDHFIGIWWSASEEDARPAGPGGKGYLSLNFSGIGTNYPLLQDIKKYVVDKGKSQVEKDRFGENYYNRGVYNGLLISEAIRNAQKLTGKKSVVGADVRRGLETLHLTEARLKEIGLPGFAAPIHVTCTDHNGHGPAFVQQWDGKKWVKITDWITPMHKMVEPLLQKAAADYVKKATGWPKRTEACDKSS